MEAAVAVLVAMQDSEYLDFKRTKLPPIGKTLHPVVANHRAATFAAAIPLADSKREADRLSAIERKNKAEATTAAAAMEVSKPCFCTYRVSKCHSSIGR